MIFFSIFTHLGLLIISYITECLFHLLHIWVPLPFNLQVRFFSIYFTFEFPSHLFYDWVCFKSVTRLISPLIYFTIVILFHLLHIWVPLSFILQLSFFSIYYRFEFAHQFFYNDIFPIYYTFEFLSFLFHNCVSFPAITHLRLFSFYVTISFLFHL